MPAFIDLTGARYDRLIVKSYAGHMSGRTAWLCVCDCKNEIIVSGNSLRRGRTKSCGCLRKENCIAQAKTAGTARGKQMIKHGESGTRLYGVWKSMKERCGNPNDKQFMNYGGRGISVCEEWKSDFSNFAKWAAETGYDSEASFGKCTLDRINNDDDYKPKNCRWVDLKTQANNRGRRKQ